MRKRSKLGDLMRRDLIESERRLTPEQRLEAYVNHCRLVREVHKAGEAYRASLPSRISRS